MRTAKLDDIGQQDVEDQLEAGADDFVQKPFNQAELLARVASLLRIKTYHDTIQQQAAELAEWNRTLETRVKEQVTELERLGRLRRFLAPQVAELLVSVEGEALLESHRRQIAVVCCQLPGFAALADTTAPEEVLAVLRAYHQGLGSVIYGFEGTVGPLVEDRLTVLFNDPLPTDDPAGQAVRLALAMRERMTELLVGWRKAGYALDFAGGHRFRLRHAGHHWLRRQDRVRGNRHGSACRGTVRGGSPGRPDLDQPAGPAGNRKPDREYKPWRAIGLRVSQARAGLQARAPGHCTDGYDRGGAVGGSRPTDRARAGSGRVDRARLHQPRDRGKNW